MTDDQKRSLLASSAQCQAQGMLLIAENMMTHLVSITDPAISVDRVLTKMITIGQRVNVLMESQEKHCAFANVLMNPQVDMEIADG